MNKKSVLLVFLLLLSSSLFAQPFGLKMGMTLNEVKNVCSRIAVIPYLNNYYRIEPPRRSPFFSSYSAYIHPVYGLHKVKAQSNNIFTDGRGEEIRKSFNELIATISATYGKYYLYDSIDKNSPLTKEDDWMISLIRGDRLLFATWEKGKGSNLPDDISEIVVNAIGSSKYDGFLSIDYESSKYLTIMQEELKNDSVF